MAVAPPPPPPSMETTAPKMETVTTYRPTQPEAFNPFAVTVDTLPPGRDSTILEDYLNKFQGLKGRSNAVRDHNFPLYRQEFLDKYPDLYEAIEFVRTHPDTGNPQSPEDFYINHAVSAQHRRDALDIYRLSVTVETSKPQPAAAKPAPKPARIDQDSVAIADAVSTFVAAAKDAPDETAFNEAWENLAEADPQNVIRGRLNDLYARNGNGLSKWGFFAKMTSSQIDKVVQESVARDRNALNTGPQQKTYEFPKTIAFKQAYGTLQLAYERQQTEKAVLEGRLGFDTYYDFRKEPGQPPKPPPEPKTVRVPEVLVPFVVGVAADGVAKLDLPVAEGVLQTLAYEAIYRANMKYQAKVEEYRAQLEARRGWEAEQRYAATQRLAIADDDVRAAQNDPEIKKNPAASEAAYNAAMEVLRNRYQNDVKFNPAARKKEETKRERKQREKEERKARKNRSDSGSLDLPGEDSNAKPGSGMQEAMADISRQIDGGLESGSLDPDAKNLRNNNDPLRLPFEEGTASAALPGNRKLLMSAQAVKDYMSTRNTWENFHEAADDEVQAQKSFAAAEKERASRNHKTQRNGVHPDNFKNNKGGGSFRNC